MSEGDGGKGLTRLRNFRIDRKDVEGEKEMNRPDVISGWSRIVAEKMRRRKGKRGGGRNGRVTRERRRSGTWMVGKKARRELVME